MKLLFGKFRGEDLCDVEIGYLRWLDEQEWLSAELREEVEFEIARREGDVSSLGREVRR